MPYTTQPYTTQFWKITAKAGAKEADIDIFGSLGDNLFSPEESVTVKSFRESLKSIQDAEKLNIHINSPGGEVFTANAIYSLLKQCRAKKTVFIDGLAASGASLIAMAGDEIIMPPNAMMMIHNPYCFCTGASADMRRCADYLDKVAAGMKAVYAERTGLSEERVAELLDAETWMTADEALELGFATGIDASLSAAACADGEVFARYRHVPEQIRSAAEAQKGESVMEITSAAELKLQYPSLVEAVAAAAAKEERERIRAIWDNSAGSPAKDVKDAMFDHPVAFQDFAVTQFKAQAAKAREKAGKPAEVFAKVLEDAKDLPPVSASAPATQSAAEDGVMACLMGRK